MSEQNKALIQHFVEEAFNEGNLEEALHKNGPRNGHRNTCEAIVL